MINNDYGFNIDCTDFDVNRRCAPTAYAVAQEVWVQKESRTAEGDAACYWWLRSPGYLANCAAYVLCYGDVLYAGYTVNSGDIGVRPALIINLE